MTEPRLTIPAIRARKDDEKIVVITAYTAPIAAIADKHADILLVGDSLGMVIYGMDSTLAVTPQMMLHHAQAVTRASRRALVIVDLPFGSYQASPAQAFETSAYLMAESGAHGIKLEGGREMAETVAFLTARGIPVMGHVGLMPQHVHTSGGYRYQGRTPEDARRILDDARAVQEAGAFSVVLEATQEDVAREVTDILTIPTIGIGASPACDGQVLVVDDLLGITEKAPGFVKQYATLRQDIDTAIGQYTSDVRSGAFPSLEHCFSGKKT